MASQTASIMTLAHVTTLGSGGFARQWGFQSRPCTLELQHSNGVAKRFIGVQIEVVHAGVDSKKDPKVL